MENLIKSFNEQYDDYLHDESRSIGRAESISFPKSEEEVCQLLAELSQRGLPVTVQGARTGLAAAAVPNGGHIMNLGRMNRVMGCRQSEGRFSFLLQPGVILSEFQKMLEKKQFRTDGWSQDAMSALAAFRDAEPLFFPPDPTEISASIGGMVACNASGARSFLFGATRKHIRGLHMALADGRLLRLRRGQVFAQGRQLTLPLDSGPPLELTLPGYQMPDCKNASGYYVTDDMDGLDLLIGSDGTLGVFTQIEVELRPAAPVVWGVNCFFPDEKMVVDFVMQARGRINGLAALEFFDGDALELLRRQKEESQAFSRLPDIPAGVASCLSLELQCQDEEQAAGELFAIGHLLEACGGSRDNTWVARTELDQAQLRFFRHAVPESANMLIDRRRQTAPNITKLGTDMSVPDDCLPAVVAMYRRDLTASGLQSAIWGHIGDNHLHVNILPRSEEEYRIGKGLYHNWAREITAMGGAVAAEHGIGKLKRDFLRTMYADENIAAMAALKRQFDPAGLLGQGNLFSEASMEKGGQPA